MTEMNPNEDAMDRLLRSSLAAPVPTLPPDFDQRVLRELRCKKRPLGRYSQILLAGYGAASAAVSAVVMRGQGLHWGLIGGMILASLAVLALAVSAVRETQPAMSQK